MNEKLLQQYETLMLKQNKNPDKDNKSLFNKIERANETFFEMQQKASQLEEEGSIDKAIEIYEKMISYATDLPGPYNRLAIFYRTQKRYHDEVRVLERAVYVYENVVFVHRTDRLKKLNMFKERLEKAKKLLHTSNESVQMESERPWGKTSNRTFIANWLNWLKNLRQ